MSALPIRAELARTEAAAEARDESWRDDYHDVYTYAIEDAEGETTWVAAKSAHEALDAQREFGWDDLDHLPATIRACPPNEVIQIDYESDYEVNEVPHGATVVTEDEGGHPPHVLATAARWANHFTDRTPATFCSTRWAP